MNKKIIICFTGEPRAFLKGLKAREKILDNRCSNFDIQTRYYITFGTNSFSENSSLIMKTIKDFEKDKKLRSLIIERINIKNIISQLIKQKLNILKEIINDENELENITIILTRTDWFFSDNCINLLFKAIKSNKVITPFGAFPLEVYKGIEYKAVFDQFMIIPGNLLNETIESLKKSLMISRNQNSSHSSKNRKLNLHKDINVFDSQENLLGIGFFLTNLKNNHIAEKNFTFSFKPDIYGLSRHNLIRNDAHKWMNLTPYDIIKKLFNWYFIYIFVRKLKKFFKLLKI
tara:strand:+ start:2581 stop:3447 length:867 start_codon:yes stop_codon:yes gene_type:complete